MLNQATFRNFKALRNLSTSLERFTVLVGPNASGKSSILLGLQLLCDYGRQMVANPAIQPVGLRSFFSLGVLEEGLLLECCSNGQGCFHLQALFQQVFRNQINADQYHLAWRDSSAVDKWQPLNKPQVIPSSALLRLEATNLARPKYTAAEKPVLEQNGSGLHSTLAYLALNQPDVFMELQKTLSQIIPSIRRIRFTRTLVREMVPVHSQNGVRSEGPFENREFTTELVLFDTVGANSIPAQLASEGTLLVLGILTVLYGPDRPQLVLLDDLDRGLHPKAQLELVDSLRAVLDRFQDLQIIATTHSPYILDKLTSKEVRLTLLGDDGWAMCGRLEDHPEFERWKEEMTPGEFWMMFGEKWLATAVHE